MSDQDSLSTVLSRPWEVLGRVMPASNATFLAQTVEDHTRLVYKPISGEAPLWDFPDRTLAHREVAAYLVSEATGWDIVPETVLAEGPEGPGMVQRWREPVSGCAPIDVVPPGSRGQGWLHVIDGVDAEENPVWLVHEDSTALRRMALFDAMINNSDRKGGHVLPLADGVRQGIDHGVSFHVTDKLRTVLWGWAGEPFTPDEITVMQSLAQDPELAAALGEHLAQPEVWAFQTRVERLVDTGIFPFPSADWPAVPWPPF